MTQKINFSSFHAAICVSHGWSHPLDPVVVDPGEPVGCRELWVFEESPATLAGPHQLLVVLLAEAFGRYLALPTFSFVDENAELQLK